MSKYITIKEPVGVVHHGDSDSPYVCFNTYTVPARLEVIVKDNNRELATVRHIEVYKENDVIKHRFAMQGTVTENQGTGIFIDVTSENITTVRVLAPEGYLITVSEIETMSID